MIREAGSGTREIFEAFARDEGFEEVAEWLETLARAEKSHAGRFQQALEEMGAA